MTCNVTGIAVSPDGQVRPNATITFTRAPFDVVGQDVGFVIPDRFSVRTNSTGSVDFDILPGVYIGSLKPAGFDAVVSFRFSVPDEVSADFADCLTAGYVELKPASVQQAELARDVAVDARDVAVAAADSLTNSLAALLPETTFFLTNYLHPADLEAIHTSNTASQNEARVTAAVQACHDAAMAWWNGANRRNLKVEYPAGVIAINDEMFSEDFADKLYAMAVNRDRNKPVFHGPNTRFQAKNWLARARVRTGGLSAARGITYPVPTAMFRWEQSGPRAFSPLIEGNITLEGAGVEATDPILFKALSLNIANLENLTLRGSRNWGLFIEAAFNSDIRRPQVERCGFQPTEYGSGTGLIPQAAQFSNTGAVVTSTVPVFDASHVGRRFMLAFAGPASTLNRQVHSGIIASVDSATQITMTDVPANAAVNRRASFEAVACATTAGSAVITLTRGDIPSLVGRYITVAGCGQIDPTPEDGIGLPEPEIGTLTAVVLSHVGDQVTLSHAARETVALAPLVVAGGFYFGRAAENYSVRNRTDDTTISNIRSICGTAFDQMSPNGVFCYLSSVTIDGGSKLHGASTNQNNFGGNFCTAIWDYAMADVPGAITAHGGYSSRFGKHIFVGGWIDVGLSGDVVAYPDTTETADIYVAPYATQRMFNIYQGQSRGDGRVGNAVKARYGANGIASMVGDYFSVRRLKRGIPASADDETTPEGFTPGTTPLAVPDWPRRLHDVVATGDVFAPAYGSTRANAAARIAEGFWTPQNGVTYQIEGLPHTGQTGATEIADLPGLVWRGYKTNGLTLTAPAVTLGTGQRISWQTSLNAEQAYILGNNTQIDAFVGATNALRLTTGGAQVTGLLTGTAVTQTQTDTTANRLLKVGDFGLGVTGNAPILANLDDSTAASGFYRSVHGTTTGTFPTVFASAQNAHIIMHTHAPGVRWQIFAPVGNAGVTVGNMIWTRQFAPPGVWGAWSRLYGQNNVLGTVTQDAGVPTGALIESGSNANGRYTRFADGTQICTHVIPGVVVATPLGSIFTTSAEVAWTFPAVFSTTDHLSCIGGGNRSADSLWSRVRTISTTEGRLRTYAAISAPGPFLIEVTAIGRWF